MSYSVVILSKDAENLRHCVEAITRNEPDLDPKHIIVVNDDETNLIATEFYGRLTVLGGNKPFVFARNANIGISFAFEGQGVDAVILLNDDAMLSRRHGFSEMVASQRFSPDYGLVASSCNNVGNANQQPRGAAFIRREVRMLCFVCVLIPRATWERVGPLDERFVGYGLDDDDYSLRVRKAGLKLGIFDRCFVDHGSLKSTYRGDPKTPADYRPNLQLFIEKWGHDNFGRTVRA